ncbi:hypothetical protein GIB67_011349 [Kingdonia uniflora]|uniref:Uncharacterized protein n=1 Tax=Kingdonia uniflora TaxID=39325 RepID=A0A7J7LCS2_9MAGN|nr:hypothetical protein GIB67_011349 [Kingdonia uniflora]
MRRIETSIAQLASGLSTRDKGTFPSQTQPNLKDQTESLHRDQANVVITLRSGKTIDNKVRMPEEKSRESPNPSTEKVVEGGKPIYKETPFIEEETGQVSLSGKIIEDDLPRIPRAPFPQWFVVNRKNIPDEEVKEMIKNLKITIPFHDALRQIFSYVKHLKDLCTFKKRDNLDVDDLINEVNALLDSIPTVDNNDNVEMLKVKDPIPEAEEVPVRLKTINLALSGRQPMLYQVIDRRESNCFHIVYPAAAHNPKKARLGINDIENDIDRGCPYGNSIATLEGDSESTVARLGKKFGFFVLRLAGSFCRWAFGGEDRLSRLLFLRHDPLQVNVTVDFGDDEFPYLHSSDLMLELDIEVAGLPPDGWKAGDLD